MTDSRRRVAYIYRGGGCTFAVICVPVDHVHYTHYRYEQCKREDQIKLRVKRNKLQRAPKDLFLTIMQHLGT